MSTRPAGAPGAVRVDVERYVDAAAAALNLPIDAAHLDGVRRYFQLVADVAERVTTFDLDASDESGSVFHPVEARR